ncbi:hypothetical protein LINGRAPRIM_LOCUS1170 [Linum grandiflorum]
MDRGVEPGSSVHRLEPFLGPRREESRGASVGERRHHFADGGDQTEQGLQAVVCFGTSRGQMQRSAGGDGVCRRPSAERTLHARFELYFPRGGAQLHGES